MYNIFSFSQIAKTNYRVVSFRQGKNGDTVGRDRVTGKVAFVDKKATIKAEPGETWFCKITGENAGKTVLFVRPICVWPDDERYIDVQHLRAAGCQEKLTFDGYAKVNFSIDGVVIASYYAEDLEDYRNHPAVVEYQKRREAEIERLRAEQARALEEAGRVYWKDVQNIPVEEVAYSTSEYKLEVLYDEDWGLHKADPGSTILVWPVPTQELFTAEQAVEEAWGIVRERYGLANTSWLDVLEGGEDEGGCQGPNTGLVKLVWDEVARRFVKTTVTVGIPAETVEEIKKQGEEPCKVVLRTLTGYARKAESEIGRNE